MKYIPSMVFAISIVLFYLKMVLLSKGYEGILDIVMIINLSVVLFISILLALIMELWLWNKKRNGEMEQ